MKKWIKKSLPILVLTTIIFVGLSCTNSNNGNAQLKFSLTDAPSMEFSSVNIDIQGIQVGVGDANKVNWVSLDLLHPGIYNLLDYRNGKTVLLADEEFPAGTISQVRLILGPENTVIKDGIEYPLTTPSAQQSGFKINLHQVLEADMMYSFIIDFDAARSIVETGNGKFILKPVTRAFAETFGATIRGNVQPEDAKAYVVIIQTPDTLISIPEADGKFLFPGIRGGVWKVNIVANDELNEYKDQTFDTAPIVEGKITDLGTIKLVK